MGGSIIKKVAFCIISKVISMCYVDLSTLIPVIAELDGHSLILLKKNHIKITNKSSKAGLL